VRNGSALAFCLALALLLQGPARAAVLFSNIEYESPGSTANRLDLYVPDGGVAAGVPTLLYVHGGSWWRLNKTTHASFLNATADGDHAIVSANYTLATDASPSYPQALQDVNAVIRWIRTDGVSLFGLSPEIVLVGGSAGGHLVSLVGTTEGFAPFTPLPPPPGGYGVSAVISLWGVYDFVGSTSQNVERFLGAPYGPSTHDLYAEASPVTHVTPDDPPMALYHGTADTLVDPLQALAMRDGLLDQGVFSLITLSPGGPHGWPAFGGQLAVSQLVRDVIATLLAPPVGLPECADGLDDDGDGAIDHPDDPGCAAPDSLREDPRCDDQLDNDADGQVDFPLDPDCASASDGSEQGAAPVPALRGWARGVGALLLIGAGILAPKLRSARSA